MLDTVNRPTQMLMPGCSGPSPGNSICSNRAGRARTERNLMAGTAGASTQDLAKVGSILEFLEAFYRIARPPVRDIGDYNTGFLLREAELPSVPGVTLVPAGESWLVSSLIGHDPTPEIPEEFRDLFGGPLSPHERPAMSLEDDADDDAMATALRFDEWTQEVWEPWSGRWQVIEESRRFYKNLYGVRAHLERDRDSLELIWGFGRLRWINSSASIDHPLITVPVDIQLDEESRLTIAPSGPSAIENGYLSEINLADLTAFSVLRQSDAADGLDLWSESRTELLQRLLRVIDHDGVMVDDSNPPGPAAQVRDEWVLYLRRRHADYLGFIEELRHLYERGVIPPLPFLSLAVDEPSQLAPTLGEQVLDGSETSGSGEIEDNTLFLPKAANEEQFRILRYAQTQPGVTAQGPPGTGKSHTIANLICHFVAQGKRVLVTAEKEQALTVLTGQLPPAVRELSVSVLGGDQATRLRMEQAINVISTRVSGYDSTRTEREIAQFSQEIAALDAAVAQKSNQLRAARVAETTTLSGQYDAGIDPTPSAVATWLHSHVEELSFIPDHLGLVDEFPLSAQDWVALGHLLNVVDPADVALCQLSRPDPHRLTSGHVLSGQFDELDHLRSQLAEVEDFVGDWNVIDNAPQDVLDQLIPWFEQLVDWRIKMAGTWVEKVTYESGRELDHQSWQEFIGRVTQAREAAIANRRATAAYAVSVPDAPDEELLAGLREARQRFAASKGISNLRQRGAVQALEKCAVDGRHPTTAAHVDLCLYAINYHECQRRLGTLWVNQISRIGGPTLAEHVHPEDAVATQLDHLRYAVEWNSNTWASVTSQLHALALHPPADSSPETMSGLLEHLQIVRSRTQERQLTAALQDYVSWLWEGATDTNSPLWKELLDAFIDRSWSRWDELSTEVARLAGLESQVARLIVLEGRLRSVAPGFAEQIRRGQEAFPDHGVAQRSWQWRQLEGWLQAFEAGSSSSDLQRELEELAKRRLSVMEELVAARAWRGLAEGFTDAKRAALNRYLTAVRRYGKTGGVQKERWQREQREALDEAKGAVPVLVMPASRVLASFRPQETAPFDVLIVDEASQLGLLDVPILALAEKSIVVGDDKQTSPANVGLHQQTIFELIEAHLRAVKNSITLFNPLNSLYDISRQKFPDLVILSEHFRSLPAIISFSNERYYGGQMIPLRDRPPAPGWQPVGTVFVPDGYRDGKDINESEALAVVDLIAELCGDEGYESMTFGVVTLLGTAQAQRIQELLLDRLGPEAMEEREIRVGQPPSFQGDERDVVVLSLVVDRGEGRRIGSMTSNQGEQGLNVAATRAKNQMWVVHSVEADDFPAGDPRAALIRHCQDPSALDTTYANLEQRCDSVFEKDVLRAILAKGFRRVRTQHEVGNYRIDIVVEGPEARLAVECDGDAWHGPERWDDDRIRQQKLERAGWTFERIRGSAFYRDPPRALGPLWGRLEDLGIVPGAWDSGAGVVGGSNRRIAKTMAERQAEYPSEIQARSNTLDNQLAIDVGDEALTAPNPGLKPVELPPFIPPPPSTRAAIEPPMSGSLPSSEPALLVPRLEGHRARTSPGVLAPYVEWEPRPVASVAHVPDDRVLNDLLDIVSAEGPLYARRLYQLHAKAAGGSRVGREMRQMYNRLITKGLRAGSLRQIDDDLVGVIDKTLYMPGSPEVVVRELGSRSLMEVPRSEVATLTKEMGNHAAQATKREVLDAYGLVRLAQRTSDYLDECLSYSWRPVPLPGARSDG
jgi:very-short-patch-repair endonuclease